MKKLLLQIPLVLVSCGATLKLSATAPTQYNDGTCTLPLLIPTAASNPVRVHFAWIGPSSGEDSVSTTAGSPVSIQKQVPAGTYTVRAWATDAGGIGCDTTITVVLKAPPDKPRLGLLEALDKFTFYACLLLPPWGLP